MRGVAGTTLLGDGRVLVVLDVQEMFQMTVVLHDANTIRLIGACPAEDGETLLQQTTGQSDGPS